MVESRRWANARGRGRGGKEVVVERRTRQRRLGLDKLGVEHFVQSRQMQGEEEEEEEERASERERERACLIRDKQGKARRELLEAGTYRYVAIHCSLGPAAKARVNRSAGSCTCTCTGALAQ